MSNCSCGWEGHKWEEINPTLLPAAKVDGDYLVHEEIPGGKMITHEAFQEWLANPMGFVPKTQAVKDQEKRHAELVGFKDGIIPRPPEVDDDADE